MFTQLYKENSSDFFREKRLVFIEIPQMPTINSVKQDSQYARARLRERFGIGPEINPQKIKKGRAILIPSFFPTKNNINKPVNEEDVNEDVNEGVNIGGLNLPNIFAADQDITQN